MIRAFKENKVFLFFIGVISLILLIGAWIALKFGYSTMIGNKEEWLTWQNFLWPIVPWIICYPLLSIYFLQKFRSSSSKETTLATSKWMTIKDFNKSFDEYSLKDNYDPGYIMKSSVTKNSFSFVLSNTPGHASVIGSTGSGKTSMLLNPNVYVLANSKDKPSMIFSDPKGELFNTHSQMLQKSGYEVLSINLRDRKKSSFWNPLEELWELWTSGGEELDKVQQELNKEKSLSYLSELASVLFPDEAGGDKFWNSGANTIFRFFTIAFLELSDEDKSLTKEHFNIANIVSNIQQTTYDELQELLEKLPKGSYAIAAGGRNVKGAEATVAGLISNCVTTLQIYNDPIIKRITSKTNLRINPSKPQAIFLIVPDEKKAKYPFISLFVSETYKDLVSKASKSEGGKLPRRFYYILDEFGNIPKIPSMDSMITVARSRNIFFMLFLQNYSQLNEKYGNNTANTILSNCMYEYFLLTSDVDTATKFSKKLGQIELTTRSRSSSSSDKGSSSSSSSESERTRNLVHPDELMRLKMGEMIISLSREQPIRTTIDKFWEWKGLRTGEIKQKINSDYEYAATHSKVFAVDEAKKEKNKKIEGEFNDLLDGVLDTEMNFSDDGEDFEFDGEDL